MCPSINMKRTASVEDLNTSFGGEAFNDNNTNTIIPTSLPVTTSSSNEQYPIKEDTTDRRTKNTLFCLVGGLSVATVGLLVSTIVLIGMYNDSSSTNVQPAPPSATKDTIVIESSSSTTIDFFESKATSNFFSNPSDNVCSGAKLALENKLCADLDVPSPQAGANVTKGYVGNMDMGDIKPNTKPFFQSNMCAVNVHWHLGTEHYSYGQFDEFGSGPNGNAPRPEWAQRDLATTEEAKDIRGGFRCNHYDETDTKFTKPYEWKHCEGMEVGETYEVHWPHSAAGACGTVNQYQTPFYDGVFCNLPYETFELLEAQDISNAVGVHSQVFTIVNDEEFFYPDMMRGMIVDKDMGKDIHIYTGSTTGTSRDNEMCSQYAPVTWQVDRQCHMISASSFDKLCYDMKMQRSDMSDDLHAHGSRELVHDDLAANNQYYPEATGVGNRKKRNLRA